MSHASCDLFELWKTWQERHCSQCSLRQQIVFIQKAAWCSAFYMKMTFAVIITIFVHVQNKNRFHMKDCVPCRLCFQNQLSNDL